MLKVLKTIGKGKKKRGLEREIHEKVLYILLRLARDFVYT